MRTSQHHRHDKAHQQCRIDSDLSASQEIDRKRSSRNELSSPGLPLGGVCIHALYEQALRQVFGLAGYLLAPASQSMAEPVLLSERSFLFTAAGQFRIFTGFPFKSDLAIGHRKVTLIVNR